MSVHTFYRSPIALAVALTLASAAYPVFAQSAAPATATATAQANAAAPAGSVDQDLMRLSDEGMQAMRAVHAARIALFNGDPQAASEALTVAKASLQVAKVDEPINVVDVSATRKGEVVADEVFAAKMNLVPIDGRITLDETLVKDPGQKAHVANAGEHMAQGRTKAAVHELKLAEVDASFTRVLMPLQGTRRQVDKASKLVDAKQYYEANLALKAAEQGLQIDTVVVSQAAPQATKKPPAQ